MNQRILNFGNSIFRELTDGDTKKKGEDEKRLHRSGVERRNPSTVTAEFCSRH